MPAKVNNRMTKFQHRAKIVKLTNRDQANGLSK
jgi:hypothetical protein